MSRKGDCWDNAVAESFFATLRAEFVDHEHYAARYEAKLSSVATRTSATSARSSSNCDPKISHGIVMLST